MKLTSAVDAVAMGRRQVIGVSLAVLVLLNLGNARSIGFGADTKASRYLLMATTGHRVTLAVRG